ncbi:MAG TPA: FAD-dependent oxidoreductase, partial [Mycobacterium sp.]|nr:FAD-dependent oxidoreductase [Mycobacterium sp.]
QGMTVAALEALALHDYLRRADPRPQEFFRAAATHIGPTWAMNQARDQAPSLSQRKRSLSRRLADWTVNKALKAAENDIVLTEALHRVNSLIDPPSRLRDPSLIPRVIFGNLRRVARAHS